MKFTEVGIPGARLIDIEPIGDDRGFFARSWCAREFEAEGLTPRTCQANISFNPHKGTLRGVHWQTGAHAETKLVRCVRGAIYDVVVDLRPESPSYLRWYGAELTADNRRMLFVPRNCGHALITLEENTEVHYMVSEFYMPNAERGARFDDPAFGIDWPMEMQVISEKDANWPAYEIRKRGEG
jgi:dTDP-4-dehydrorhamnose 3,5-epimerase